MWFAPQTGISGSGDLGEISALTYSSPVCLVGVRWGQRSVYLYSTLDRPSKWPWLLLFFIVSHLLQSAPGLLRRTLGQDNFSNPDRIAIPGIFFFSESFSSSCFVKIASSLHCTHRDADTEWQSLSPEFQMWRQAGGWLVASLLLPEMSKHVVSRRMKSPWRCLWTIHVTDQYS